MTNTNPPEELYSQDFSYDTEKKDKSTKVIRGKKFYKVSIDGNTLILPSIEYVNELEKNLLSKIKDEKYKNAQLANLEKKITQLQLELNSIKKFLGR